MEEETSDHMVPSAPPNQSRTLTQRKEKQKKSEMQKERAREGVSLKRGGESRERESQERVRGRESEWSEWSTR